MESNASLETLLQVSPTPGHNVDGDDGDEEYVIGSDIVSWSDAAAHDVVDADAMIPALEAGTTHAALGFPEDIIDSSAVDQVSTSRRSKANKILSFAEAKFCATHFVRGLPQDRDNSLAPDQGSSSRRSSANKISRCEVSKSGATGSAGGLHHDGDNSLVLDQTSSSSQSKANKISSFMTSKSGATRSADELPHDWEDCYSLALDQASSSRQSKVNKISSFMTSTSGATRSARKWPLDGEDCYSLVLDQAASSCQSEINEISSFMTSKSGATRSAGEWPLDGEDCYSLVLDQAASSCQSEINEISRHTATTSDVTHVAAFESAFDQFPHGYYPQTQTLQSRQSYMAYAHTYAMGIASTTQCSSMYLQTPSMPVLQTAKLHETQRTTIVLRNIPKTYNTSSVVRLLETAGYTGLFDFVDVPTNRVSRTTGGFAIVNLRHPAYAPYFWKTFDGFHKWTCKSRNICRVVWYEQLQGLHEIMRRYKNLIIARKDIPKKSRPWLLTEGEWVPF